MERRVKRRDGGKKIVTMQVNHEVNKLNRRDSLERRIIMENLYCLLWN